MVGSVTSGTRLSAVWREFLSGSRGNSDEFLTFKRKKSGACWKRSSDAEDLFQPHRGTEELSCQLSPILLFDDDLDPSVLSSPGLGVV